jgi:hypothetical protein
MILDGFGFHIPSFLSPLATFGIVGYFFSRSLRVARALEPDREA